VEVVEPGQARPPHVPASGGGLRARTVSGGEEQGVRKEVGAETTFHRFSLF